MISVFELHKPIYKRANIAAFSGKMTCPYPTIQGRCGASKWQYIEKVSPFRIRYRCKVCGRTVQYDFSDNPVAIKNVYGKNTDSILRNTLWKFKHLLTDKTVR